MAFRALLFSKSPEMNAALTIACNGAGIRVDVCDDIFLAIQKGTKQPFSCLLADWACQPEAGFLLKRTRESGPNKGLIAIAIVESDPSTAEMRDHQIDFLIYRPVVAEEAGNVLVQATQRMEPASEESMADAPDPEAPTPGEDANSAAPDSPAPDLNHFDRNQATSYFDLPVPDADAAAEGESGESDRSGRRSRILRNALALLLVSWAALLLWNSRDVTAYLARTPEGTMNVLREAVATLFDVGPANTMPVAPAGTSAQRDKDGRETIAFNGRTTQIRVIEDEVDLKALHLPLPNASEIPLPTPGLQRPEPVHALRPTIPESLRSAAPITRPLVVAVTPAQMMPVSAPITPPVGTQTFNEPILVSEEAQRARLLHSVDPEYPAEARAQKLHGSVALQATIAGDGSVEDLKIIRGNFVLAKAAIAAVKQWRFQPYTSSGHAVQTRTIITVNFGPQS